MKNILKKVFAFVLMLSMLIPNIMLGVAADGDFYLSENYAFGKKTAVNNAYSKAPKESAVDGDVTSLWRTNSTCKDDFIYFIVSLGKKTDVNLVHMVLYNMERMSTVKIQYTTDSSPSDSSSWKDITVLKNKDLKQTMTVSFETVKATGIRFYSVLSTKSAGLYEFQVYNTNDVEAAKDKLSRVDFKEFSQPESNDATIVSVDENGILHYSDYDGKGSTLLDYSYVGYKKGEEAIPNVNVVKTISPGNLKDHTKLIQNAIDEVAALPEEEHGAILLKAGTYTVSADLIIDASGIVLRGEGQGENGTVIYDVRTKSEKTTLKIKGGEAYTVISESKSELVSTCVPSGQTKLQLSTVDSYNVEDNLRIVCTPNELWIKTLGMDILPGDNVTQWNPSDYVMTYERWITDIDKSGKTITINTGIPLTLDEKYFTVTVEKIVDKGSRISECGVENIRFLSYYNGSKTDENHAWTAVALTSCKNCWVRDVTAKNYAYATVQVGSKAINVTVEGCSFLEPISTVAGGLRYSFCINGGQYTLVKNCYSYDSRHDYVVQAKVCGPNVFIDCVAEESNSVSEPHHRWSNGTLYDNIFQIGKTKLGYFEALNRGNSGTGHGWAGANTIFWNCLSPAIVVGKPQTEQNFAVGVRGLYKTVGKTSYLSMYNSGFVKPSITTPNYPQTKDYENSPMYGNAYVESPYNPVDPSSLYRAQLAFRLTGDATKNVIPNAPILQYPAADSKLEKQTVEFSGICDRNADKVYVWVDGEKHEAKISQNGSYAYSISLELAEGYHEISVTQVAGEMESDHSAARTILVGEGGSSNQTPENNDNTGNNNSSTNKPGYKPGNNNNTDDGDKTTSDGNGGVVAVVIAIAVGCIAFGLGVFFYFKKFRRM